jgi:hypothetical protein
MSWDPHEAAAPELKARPAEYLALEHVEAVDMACDRARTPGERHPGFDRSVVLAEPLGTAWQGLPRTLGGARQPRSERLRLPLAQERREVLGAGEGLGHCGLLSMSLGQRLGLGFGAGLRVPEPQPGHPARRQGLVGGLRHDRPCVPCAAGPGGEALGLTSAADIGRDQGRPAGIAAFFALPKQPRGGTATSLPAFEEGGCRGIQQTAAAVTPPLAPHQDGGLAIPRHGPRADPDVRRHGGNGPALAVQRPNLGIGRLPACLALGRALVGGRGQAG